MDHPEHFLNVVFKRSHGVGDNIALCAGFERGLWRNDQFADHVMEWLPEFALNHSELEEIGHRNAVRMTKKAARTVYQSKKYGSRGEFGELFLHIAIRQIYDTIPAVSKIYYKSSINKTVEGFDAVHVVKQPSGLELWIGETKFYTSIDRAISDVCKEIVAHLETDYLRSEFLLIKNKIDPRWEEAENLQKLLSDNVSLDAVFERACVPVLLTYDSEIVSQHSSTSQEYLADIELEVVASFLKMREKLQEQYKTRFGSKLPITVHVILIPLKEKIILIKTLDAKLKALQ